METIEFHFPTYNNDVYNIISSILFLTQPYQLSLPIFAIWFLWHSFISKSVKLLRESNPFVLNRASWQSNIAWSIHKVIYSLYFSIVNVFNPKPLVNNSFTMNVIVYSLFVVSFVLMILQSPLFHCIPAIDCVLKCSVD